MILASVFAVIAALFACVGQAGGVGYIAAMGLFAMGTAQTKLTTLALTLLVAAIGIFRFQRMGLLKRRDWLPFALLGVPFSVLGGILTLPGTVYRILVGLLLLAAAAQMLRAAKAGEAHDEQARDAPPFAPALLTGAGIGLAGGLIGVGGGIFLAPVMLSLRWATTRRTAATAQMMNLLIAAAALAGVWATRPVLPPQLPLWALAAGAGGLLGAWAGAKHLPVVALRIILALILLVSSVKVMLG